MDEIGDAIRILEDNGTRNITVFHCATDYPALLKM